MEDKDLKMLNEMGRTAHFSKETAEQIVGLRNDIQTIEKTKEVTHGGRVIQELGINDAKLSVYEYDSTFVGDLSYAPNIYYAQKLGMKLRQLRADLKGGTVSFESGIFSASSGDIQQGKTPLTFGAIAQGVFRKMNDETFFRPTLTGTGSVYFDSSLKFITLLPVTKPTKVVMEKGIYLGSIGKFEFKVTKNFNPGYMMFSDKSVLQTDARGSGILALELPVHKDEIEIIEVTPDEPLLVNGNMVMLWTGSLKREVSTSGGGLVGSVTSGTGLVEKYSGTGQVWLATTLGYYSKISGQMIGKGLQNSKQDVMKNDDSKNKTSWWSRMFMKK